MNNKPLTIAGARSKIVCALNLRQLGELLLGEEECDLAEAVLDGV
jgi:hypothetical protein